MRALGGPPRNRERSDETVGRAKALLRRVHHLSRYLGWWARFALPTLRPLNIIMDCFVASLLAMTLRDSCFTPQTATTRPHSRGTICPSSACNLALEARGRREDRVRAAPAVSCANMCKESAHEHTGSAEAIRPSLRDGLTAYSVLSPENRALLPPSPADRSANLTPASRHQDHTASPYATGSVRLALPSRPPHLIPRFVTIAIRPSHRVRRGELIELICPTC
jgi:hypothetical protein